MIKSKDVSLQSLLFHYTMSSICHVLREQFFILSEVLKKITSLVITSEQEISSKSQHFMFWKLKCNTSDPALVYNSLFIPLFLFYFL